MIEKLSKHDSFSNTNAQIEINPKISYSLYPP